jgi:hypothetical protein
MKKDLLLILFIVLCIITFKHELVHCQPDCPPNTSLQEWTNGHIDVVYRHFGDIGSVDYLSRTNGSGMIEISIDWTTLTNKMIGLSDKAIQEIVEYEILSSFALCPGYDGFEGQTINTQIAIVYKTKCFVNTRCALKLDRELQIECCDDPETNPDFFVHEGTHYIERKFPIECGFKCCQRIYTVTCYWDHIYYRWFTSLSPTFTKETYPGADCSGGSTFIDCLTGQPIPCQGNCD